MADPYLIFPGTAGNYVSTDGVAITGDLDLRALVAADVGAPASRKAIMGTQSGLGGFYLSLETLGRLRIAYGDGTSVDAKTSGFPPVVEDGALIEWRATYSVAGGADSIRFYQDGVQYATQTAANSSGAAGTGLAAGALNSGGALEWAGLIYWAEVRDGIDGPVVARFDAADVPVPAQIPSP